MTAKSAIGPKGLKACRHFWHAVSAQNAAGFVVYL